MKTKHTHGPWVASETNVAQFRGHQIAITGVWNDGTNESYIECLANANLIASAPELLEACIAAHDDIIADELRADTFEKLEKAIQKATS